MTSDEAQVGTRVRTLRAWPGVEVGDEGVIIQHYNLGQYEGWLVAWEPLPPYLNERELTFENMPAYERGAPIRDGFSDEELVTLEVVK